jgi:hypothetical protein
MSLYTHVLEPSTLTTNHPPPPPPTDLLAQPDTPDYVWPFYDSFPAFYNTHPVVFCSMVLNTFQMIWETFTLREQYVGMSNNLTHNEMLNGEKYHYFQSSGGYLFNPFDKGWSKNIASFWTEQNVGYDLIYFIGQAPDGVV